MYSKSFVRSSSEIRPLGLGVIIPKGRPVFSSLIQCLFLPIFVPSRTFILRYSSGDLPSRYFFVSASGAAYFLATSLYAGPTLAASIAWQAIHPDFMISFWASA
jgi:hypothetical protein